MQFYSTNKQSPLQNFEYVLLQGQAPDRGLYMPEKIPKIPADEIASFRKMEYHEIAWHVARYIIQDEVPLTELQKITKDAYNYDIPLIRIVKNQYVMRLDQGPTASFKDFAARMMARLMQYFLKKQQKRLVILTATSGDTGGAVADAFYDLDNIDVIILYPKAEISERQRRQMTTLGKNVTALGLDGKFDNCQALVKEAFASKDLAKIPLSSANSINFGRLLPQSVYYFYAYSRLATEGQNMIFSVPSGNFGDLMGGILAREMGLPVKKFIVAVNENDEFVKFLGTGKYQKIDPSRNCLSSAMNVGHPSNLARLVDLYGGHLDEKGNLLKIPDMTRLQKDFWGVSISDSQTKEIIKRVYQSYQYILEPHGAVSWGGIEQYLEKNNVDIPLVAFETADPAKFPDQIRELINIDPPLPKSLEEQASKKEILTDLSNNFADFKSFLLKRY